MNEAPTPKWRKSVKATITAPAIKPAQAGSGNGSSTRQQQQLDECMQAWPGRGSDVSCLSGLLCLPVRFVASFFLSLHSTPTPTPRHMQGRGRRPEGREKGNYTTAAEWPAATAHRSPRSPPSRSARVKANRAAGTLWRRHRGRPEGVRPGQGPQKKGTWRKRRPEYVHTHPSSPTQSNPGRASFLPFHIHIPCRTGTGSGTGTTLDRE